MVDTEKTCVAKSVPDFFYSFRFHLRFHLRISIQKQGPLGKAKPKTRQVPISNKFITVQSNEILKQ